MKKRDEAILNHLHLIAADIVPVRRFRHAAAIVVKREIVGLGVNQLKSHPLQMKFSRNADSIFLHAEIDALRNALYRVTAADIEKATLYVLRLDSRGQRGNSAPCAGCAKMVQHFNIQRVVHT